MPFVLVRYNPSTEPLLTDEVLDAIAAAVADILPGDLDPIDDIDLNLAVRHPDARSKYEVTIDIEAMRTDERAELLEGDLTEAIKRRINLCLSGTVTFNVWLKLVHAGYASSS